MATVAKNAIYTTLKTNKDDRAIPEPRFWYPLFKEQEWDMNAGTTIRGKPSLLRMPNFAPCMPNRMDVAHNLQSTPE